MELTVIVAVVVLVLIIIIQQNYINKMEDRVFHSLKITCETLDLIKKDCKLEDILEMSKKGPKPKMK